MAKSGQRIDQMFRWTLPNREPWATRENGVSLIGVFFVVLVLVLAYWFTLGYW